MSTSSQTTWAESDFTDPRCSPFLLTSFPHHSSEQLLGTDEQLFFPKAASDKQVMMWSISTLHHPCKRWGSFCQKQPCFLFVRCNYLLDAQKLPLCLCLPAWFALAVTDFNSSRLFQLLLALSIKANPLSLIFTSAWNTEKELWGSHWQEGGRDQNESAINNLSCRNSNFFFMCM